MNHYKIVFSYVASDNFSSTPLKISLKAEVFSDFYAAGAAVNAEQEIPGRSSMSRLCKMSPDAIDKKIEEFAERLAYDYQTIDGIGKHAQVTVEKILWINGENPRLDSSPMGFIRAAYADVQALTDDGDQMHRRAVVGKPLYVHLHGWDRWAHEVPAAGGMSEVRGGCAVTLRVQGQYMDRGVRYTAKTPAEAVDFVKEVEFLLHGKSVPVPVPATQNNLAYWGLPHMSGDEP